MRSLKITIIGAGSTYSPELVDGFIKRQDSMKVKEFALMDVNLERLKIVGGLIKRMCREGFEDLPEVTFHDSIESALTGADYVVTQLRVGGMPARAQDEIIPLKYCIIGQETTGPGGFMKALRTIPHILKIAKCIEEKAPNAYLINFTNPSGIITEAVTKYSNIKVAGLCNSPITIKHAICEVLDIPRESLYLDYIGLNHLGWIRGLFVDGEDRSEELFEKIANSKKIAYMLGYPFNKRLIKALKMLPCGYLQYYYHTDEILEKLKAAKVSRGQQLIDVDKQLLIDYSDPNLRKKPAGLEQRGGAWYSEAAVALIDSIVNDKKEIHIVNVVNNGTLGDLAGDAVIEAPALTCGSCIKPLSIGSIPPGIAGLIKHVKEYESLTVKAGAERSKEIAFLALVNHPFVKSVDDAERMFEELLEANEEYVQLNN